MSQNFQQYYMVATYYSTLTGNELETVSILLHVLLPQMIDTSR